MLAIHYVSRACAKYEMIGTKCAAKWKNKTVINACETGDDGARTQNKSVIMQHVLCC